MIFKDKNPHSPVPIGTFMVSEIGDGMVTKGKLTLEENTLGLNSSSAIY